MKFSITDFFSKCDQIQFAEALVTFTAEIRDGNFHFLCSVRHIYGHTLFLPGGTFISNFYKKKVEQKN